MTFGSAIVRTVYVSIQTDPALVPSLRLFPEPCDGSLPDQHDQAHPLWRRTDRPTLKVPPHPARDSLDRRLRRSHGTRVSENPVYYGHVLRDLD
jgi:hypothetical protein